MSVEYRTINPRRMGLRPHVVDRKAVEFYRKHPHKAYGGGRPPEMPSLDYNGGRYRVMQGNHRIAAAIAEGRSIEVEIRRADGSKGESAKPRGFWGWLCS